MCLFYESIWYVERAWTLEIQSLAPLPPSCVIFGQLYIFPEQQFSHLWHVNPFLKVVIRLRLAKCLLIDRFLMSVNFLTLFFLLIEDLELKFYFHWSNGGVDMKPFYFCVFYIKDLYQWIDETNIPYLDFYPVRKQMNKKKNHVIYNWIRFLTWKWHWDDLIQWFSKCSPPTSSTSITWEFVRNTNSWSPPPPAGSNYGDGTRQPEFPQAPGDPEECLSFRPSIQINPLNFREEEAEHWITNHQDWNKISQSWVQCFVQKFSSSFPLSQVADSCLFYHSSFPYA